MSVFIESNYLKERLFIPDLVICYSKDAQRDWIKCGLQISWKKVQIPKRYVNDFFQRVEEFRSYIKCRYRIIDRPILIKVLWELSYSNTPIKDKL